MSDNDLMECSPDTMWHRGYDEVLHNAEHKSPTRKDWLVANRRTLFNAWKEWHSSSATTLAAAQEYGMNAALGWNHLESAEGIKVPGGNQ